VADLQPNFKPGDPWTAAAVNQLVAGQQLNIRAGPGLTVRQGRGHVQINAVAGDRAKVCIVASGGLTARSGDTPGTGSVELWTVDPSSGDLMDSGIQLDDVQNFSTGAVAENTYGWVAWDDDAVPWFVLGAPGGQLPAKPDGTISARSGTTAGSGTVFLVDDSTPGTLTVTATTQAVYNYSATAGGIATGKYCWIAQSPNGSWYVISVEC